MAQKPKTCYAILGALTVFPMSGYDIKKWVRDVTGQFWAESSGRIYPILKQLLQKKLIICDETKGCGRRPRKLYKITRLGLKMLQHWLEIPAEPWVSRDEFKLKLFYGKNLSPKIFLQHIKNHQKKVLADLEHHKKVEAHIRSSHKNLADSYYWLLTLRGAIHHGQAELKWCEEMRKEFLFYRWLPCVAR